MDFDYDGSESEGFEMEEESLYNDETALSESSDTSGPMKLNYIQQTIDEVKESLIRQCNSVDSILKIGFDDCFVLLVKFGFNSERLMEKYLDSAEETRSFGGLSVTSSKVSPSLVGPLVDSFCLICAEEKSLGFRLSNCNHSYCCDCYAQYCYDKLSDQATLLPCPEPSCPLLIRPSELEQLSRYVVERGVDLGGEREKFQMQLEAPEKIQLEEEDFSDDEEEQKRLKRIEQMHLNLVNYRSRRFQIRMLKEEFERNSTLSNKMMTNTVKHVISTTKGYKWCPAPDCPGVIRVLPFDSSCPVSTVPEFVEHNYVPIVECSFDHAFCFHCNFENHNPTVCSVAQMWIQKCKDDSETVKWLSANTKECPRCGCPIEKNGGCNHMSCTKCRYDFCWICLGVWANHGFYNCNKFNEQDSGKLKTQEVSRKDLFRYLHYYNHFMAHEQSMKQDSELCSKMEDKIQTLQSTSGISWIEAQFYSNSINSLQKGRRSLKWSFALVYYLQNNNAKLILENNQSYLMGAVESLSKLFEVADPIEISKRKLEFINAANFVLQRRKALEDHVADAMREGSLKLL